MPLYIIIIALFFLFIGEPDLWGNLHEKAMKETKVENTIINKQE